MLKHNLYLSDKILAHLEEGSRHFGDYIEAVDWAQNYAAENRAQMLELVLEARHARLPEFRVMKHAINCHHNYAAKETHYGAEVYVTRKGAHRVGKEKHVIIPGSMGAKSYIVRGKGNAASFCSYSAPIIYPAPQLPETDSRHVPHW